MSLVGSLEDLGLADILQIMSLSRKSGTLVLRCEDGEGRIVFREGLVHAATVKGEGEELAELALRDAAGGSASAAPGSPARERLEALRRACVERAVVRMFEWHTGEFSFEVNDEGDARSSGLALAIGLSPQYLTMEATRRGDERRAGDPEASDEAFELSGEGWGDEADAAAADPLEALVSAAIERSDPLAPAAATARPAATGAAAAAAPEPPSPARAACSQLVVIDPDLAALEWLKAALAGLFERIHIFQAAQGGIARIRQYLSRAELPALLLSARAPMDPLSGIDTASELFRRLRVQAPRMPLVVVAEEGSAPPRAASLADACVVRPTTAALLEPRSAARVAAAARALRARLAPFAASAAAALGPRDEAVGAERIVAQLREAAREEDVHSLVLDFAAARFGRAAIFRMRDGRAEGVAQRGLARAAGPDDAALRGLRLAAAEAGWFRRVLESGAARVSPPTDEGDRALADRLGSRPAPVAYVAPIHGERGVVALLYADNLPEAQPLPETAGLAIVLHEAGLALERAARASAGARSA
jgi:hypothetical protein